ncbi:hypothetical protein FYJ79_11845 [Sharpea azabuensis]|uniref:LSM domain protein n=1 Tax=Sharpea porci TaxID=2652286 RepID=A0A844FXF5_9FIRM|nr:hypothetical protein [Sharpea porci]MST90246.1 hypothetical protein [Sharpea porci]
MNLLKYNNKRVKLITNDDVIYQGMAYFCDADDYETEEDELTIKNQIDNRYYGVANSEIKSIEIIEHS